MELVEEVLESDFQEMIHNPDSILFTRSTDDVSIREEPTIGELMTANNLNDLNLRAGDKLNIARVEKRGKSINLELFIEAARDKALSRKHITRAMAEILIPEKVQAKNANDNSTIHLLESGLFTNYVPNRYDSICQGVPGNCYFMAALSAVAWVCPAILNKIDIDFISNGEPLRYYYYFGKTNISGEKWGWTYAKHHTIGDNHLPIFGSSRDWKNGDNWVAYWEQMYTSYRFGSSTYNDIMKTSGGMPTESMKAICGNRYSEYRIILQSNSISSIKQALYNNTDGYWKAIRPMTLVTWRATLPNLPNGHAYTVLGVKYINGAYYVIIRNPWGNTEPSGAGILSGEYLMMHFNDNERFLFSKNDGIFAMEVGLMKQQFDYLEYVY